MKPLSLHVTLLVCFGVLLTATLPGCSGCRPEDPVAKKKREDEEKKKKKKEKPKDDFEVARVTVQPSDPSSPQNLVKPGHWITAAQQMRANNFDFQAELESASVDRNGQPIDVEHTPFHLLMSRPASLPKGEVKHFEMTYFIPHRMQQGSSQVWLQSKLRAARGGREVTGAMQPTTPLPAHEYFFVVLSSNANNYGYVKRLDSVMPIADEFIDESQVTYYRVVLPLLDRGVPLPSHPLTWTGIAYILWDEVDPNQFNPDQQLAMLDWLHWGGQLIVSGPNSLDMLKGSFLAPYLPAEKVETVELQQSDFDEINDYWSLPEAKRQGERRTLDVIAERPPLGIELKLDEHPDVAFAPHTGNLVAERRVGRGRIVVTAFSLSQTNRQLVNWPNYDGFFNGCLLRRPRREFREVNYGPQVVWADHPALVKDARLVSTLRYFTRDIGYLPGIAATGLPDRPPEIEIPGELEVDPFTGELIRQPPPSPSTMDPETDDPHFSGFRAAPGAGVGGWNDFSGSADAARRSLKDAAGISVPRAQFVAQVLAGYLLVLVPVNWAVFRVIGRVEWAWVAAPLIAIVGAIAVVRMAQLDIGFARSRTEIAVLEVQGQYGRAHLTRYTALYTSLSTGYDLEFEDPSALAQPFSADPTMQLRLKQTSRAVSFRRDKEVSLRGFQVDSNSTGLVHCEQMLNLGGGFQLIGNEDDGYQLANNSHLVLQDVGVLRRLDSGQIEAAWVGGVAAKSTAPLRFGAAADNQPRVDKWDESATMSGAGQQGEVSLASLVALASQRLRLNRGDVRLIGWTDEELPGVAIWPKASQSTLRTLVLVHVRYGPMPDTLPDKNSKADVLTITPQTETDPEPNLFPE